MNVCAPWVTIFQNTPDGAVTTLYSFTGGSDGAYPMGALIQGADNNLYGTTQSGGNVGCGGTCGTIFQFNPADGTFTTLHAFEDSEGGVPHAGLIQASDMNFYGTTGSGSGTIFRIAADGTFMTLHAMNLATDGGGPSTPLIQATDGNLYGAANGGGPSRSGTIFRIALDGTFSVIQTFSDLDGGFGPSNALLQASDGNFYGMTAGGGLYAQGTIFRMTVDGTVTVLHSFMAPGGMPNQSGLIEGADGNLYGTTNSQAHGGTAFQMAPDGAVTTLHLFDGFSNGFNPSALIQATDGDLYGTTSNGGSDSSNRGMVFRLRITP